MSEREIGSSNRSENVKIKLGEHTIAEELRGLKLGRILDYQYCPHAQGILTPVFESFSG